ncbi:hypothetical protein D3C76_1453720 [compost metagenome]
MTRRDIDLFISRSSERGDFLRVTRLVKLRALIEGASERLELLTLEHSRCQTDDRAGIQTTGQVRPQRNIRAQVQTNGVVNQTGQGIDEVPLIV